MGVRVKHCSAIWWYPARPNNLNLESGMHGSLELQTQRSEQKTASVARSLRGDSWALFSVGEELLLPLASHRVTAASGDGGSVARRFASTLIPGLGIWST